MWFKEFQNKIRMFITIKNVIICISFLLILLINYYFCENSNEFIKNNINIQNFILFLGVFEVKKIVSPQNIVNYVNNKKYKFQYEELLKEIKNKCSNLEFLFFIPDKKQFGELFESNVSFQTIDRNELPFSKKHHVSIYGSKYVFYNKIISDLIKSNIIEEIDSNDNSCRRFKITEFGKIIFIELDRIK